MKKILLLALTLLSGCAAALAQQGVDLSSLAARNVLVENDWGHGSGVIYKTDTILTAGHMFGPNLKVNGENATVVAIDTAHDIMALAVKTGSFPALTLVLKNYPLQKVIVIGNPLDMMYFFSVGYVGYASDDYIMTSNIPMPGFSGGGAFDENGSLVGIATAGLGTCQFGFTIDRLTSARRVLKFLFEKPHENLKQILQERAAKREARKQSTQPPQCGSDRSIAPFLEGETNADKRSRSSSQGDSNSDVQGSPRR